MLTARALAARFESQLLGRERAPDPEAVAERLLAVQAQDLRSARLAVRARTKGLSASDVDRCLDERRLVVGWLNRGTLQLVRPDDYWWLHALTTPQLFTGNARRLRQTGVSEAAAERGVAAIEAALANGPLTRDELRDVVAARRVTTAGQALVHLLMLTCLRGIALRGPIVRGKHAYVLARDWIGGPPPVNRDRALAELGRRYLAGHAQADERDLAKWAGLPLRDARAALGSVPASLPARPGKPRPCLLDQWDPILVGWSSREALLVHHPGHDSPLTDYQPFAWVNGRAVATWSLARAKVTLAPPYVELPAAAAKALAADAADVERFFKERKPRSTPG